MLKAMSVMIAVLILAVMTSAVGPLPLNAATQRTPGEPWPELQPYKTGYLQVSKLHRLFYQLGGNPEGKAVMVLHGGPGAGCNTSYFRYFNGEKFHVVLHDQRGAGKSEPFAEIKENTTPHLVEDIETLRRHLGLGPVILFGGSWGSTLALAYAEAYPQNVKGMILRGIFTAAADETDHFYHGGTAIHFPEYYRELTDLVGQPLNKDLHKRLLAKMQDPDPAVRKKYALAWAKYEGKVAFLHVKDEEVAGWFKTWDPTAFSVIENHYMANNCFLKERQLLDNAHKLAGIATVIVNGRYDVICPPRNAYRLHKLLPESRLVITEKCGHSASESETRRQLTLAAEGFE